MTRRPRGRIAFERRVALRVAVVAGTPLESSLIIDVARRFAAAVVAVVDVALLARRGISLRVAINSPRVQKSLRKIDI